VILLLISFWQDFAFPIVLIFGIAVIYSMNFLGREEKLSRERKRLLDGELPTFIQYLTLMISSGLSPLRAIEIISRQNNQIGRRNRNSAGAGSSIILEEMQYLIVQIRNGATIIQGLEEFVRRTETQAARRFANSMIIALDRGTPLVPVLTALIRDSRVDSKNTMLRSAGKAEIALMIPIVFLLLPISVLFALFPSLSQLQIF
jgi:tight adherence protein C